MQVYLQIVNYAPSNYLTHYRICHSYLDLFDLHTFGFVIAIDATHLDISRHMHVHYVPYDVYATELRFSLSLSLSLSLILTLILVLCKSVAASAIMDLWPKDALQPGDVTA